MSRSRNWCFTINNYSNEEIEKCNNVECNYIIYGDETGAEGTPHLQGYLEFKDAKTLSSVKKMLGGRAHLEIRRGTPLQASDYCKKEGKFVERGELSHQGKRTDLEEIADLVKTGGIEKVVEERPDAFIKYGKNIERLSELLMKPRDMNKPPTIKWLWGSAGVGKTKSATANCDSFYTWNSTKWWNGYRQQQRIVIDDFDYDVSDDKSLAKYRYLLRLLDRYPIQVETKGGMIHINSPEIFITCEFPPDHYWTDNKLLQITRRLDEIVHILPEEIYDDPLINDVLIEMDPPDNIDEEILDKLD